MLPIQSPYTYMAHSAVCYIKNEYSRQKKNSEFDLQRYKLLTRPTDANRTCEWQHFIRKNSYAEKNTATNSYANPILRAFVYAFDPEHERKRIQAYGIVLAAFHGSLHLILFILMDKRTNENYSILSVRNIYQFDTWRDARLSTK